MIRFDLNVPPPPRNRATRRMRAQLREQLHAGQACQSSLGKGNS